MTDSFEVKKKNFRNLLICGMYDSDINPLICIPAYQRKYTWNEFQILQLLSDVYDYFVVSNEQGANLGSKFIGSIILVQKDNNSHIYDIVDGQQRLCSFNLILAAGLKILVEIGKDVFLDASKLSQILTDKKSLFYKAIKKATCQAIPGYFSIRMRLLEQKREPAVYIPRIYREEIDAPKGKHHSIDLLEIDDDLALTTFKSPLAKMLFFFAKTRYSCFKTPEEIEYTKPININSADSNPYSIASEFLSVGISQLKHEDSFRKNFSRASLFLEQLSEGMTPSAESDFSFNKGLKDEQKISPSPYPSNLIINSDDNEANSYCSYLRDLLDLETPPIIDNHDKITPFLHEIKSKLQKAERIISYLEFLINKVHVAAISGSRETALDIFETVNTAGEPLDCIETFIPEIYEKIKEIDSISNTKESYLTRKYSFGAIQEKSLQNIISEIRELFGTQKNRNGVPQIVSWFGLIIFGKKVGKNIRIQRWELKREFEAFLKIGNPALDDHDAIWKNIFEFTSLLLTTARWWVLLNGTSTQNCQFNEDNRFIDQWAFTSGLIPARINPNDIEHRLIEQFNFCLHFLKDAGQAVDLAIAGRFYIQLIHNPSVDNLTHLIKAIQALSSFSAIWLSYQTGSGNYVESQRRVLSRKQDNKNYKGKQTIGELCYFSDSNTTTEIEHGAFISVTQLQESLRTALSDQLYNFDLKSWLYKFPKSEFACDRPTVARFLLFLYWYCTDQELYNPNFGIRRHIDKPNQNFLTGRLWKELSKYQIEHIVPKNFENWKIDIIPGPDASETINQVGNFTLLPAEMNIFASNNCWDYKKQIYKAISASDYDEIKHLSGSKDNNKKTNALIKQLQRLDDAIKESNTFLVTSLLEITKWSKSTISTRTEAIAHLIWPLLSEWLGERHLFNKENFDSLFPTPDKTSPNKNLFEKLNSLFSNYKWTEKGADFLLLNNQAGYLKIQGNNKEITLTLGVKTKKKHFKFSRDELSKFSTPPVPNNSFTECPGRVYTFTISNDEEIEFIYNKIDTRKDLLEE